MENIPVRWARQFFFQTTGTCSQKYKVKDFYLFTKKWGSLLALIDDVCPASTIESDSRSEIILQSTPI